MKSLFDSAASSISGSRRPAKRRKPTSGLAGRIEGLEKRELLTSIGAGVDLNDGTLTIDGTNVADEVRLTSEIEWDTSSVIVRKSETVTLTYQSANGRFVHRTFQPDEVDMIRFKGRDGNDTFINETQVTAWAWGDNGDDTLRSDAHFTGNRRDNMLHGGSGNDVIIGGNGDDWLYGHDGDKTYGSDDDFIMGGGGQDTIYGGVGRDILFGGAGNDTLSGSLGDDLILGGDGDDLIEGGTENDTLFGGDGNDTLSGQWGFDVLYGGDGDRDVFVRRAPNFVIDFNTGFVGYQAKTEHTDQKSNDATMAAGSWTYNWFRFGRQLSYNYERFFDYINDNAYRRSQRYMPQWWYGD